MPSTLSHETPFAALAVVTLLVTVCSCTTTLDPSVPAAEPGSGDSGGSGGSGGSGEGGVPLATCSLARSAESEYVICPEPLAFEAAAADCALRDASLAAVGSAEEDDFIATRVYGLVAGNLWLGGLRDDDYVWSWPDGGVFWRGGRDGMAEGDAYVRWQPGEPNDSSTVTTDPERCLALTLGGNDWNDRACSLRIPYVCERPL